PSPSPSLFHILLFHQSPAAHRSIHSFPTRRSSDLIAPTCFECEQKYGKSLEYLLARHKDRKLVGGPHMYSVGGVTYVYWIRKDRSEEHTSELQSRFDLVCRLLLEKKTCGKLYWTLA